jgi:hypothetical protein
MHLFFDLPFVYAKMLHEHGYKNLVEDMYRYENKVREWNPDYIDLMRGMGEGASSHLDKSKYAAHLTHYEKALFMHVYGALAFCHPVGRPDPDVREHTPIDIPAESAYWRHANSPPSLDQDSVDEMRWLDAHYLGFLRDLECTSIAALPAATASGKTMLAGNTQYGYGVGTYTMAFVVQPSDGNRFWTSTIPGIFMFLKGANEKGLAYRGQYGGNADSTYGVLSTFMSAEMMAYADNVEEAVEVLTRGRPEYRERTGRKTPLRQAGIFWTLADERDVAVVETSARYYGVRRAGDLGEKDFVVCANHAYVDHSYDENDRRTDVPMTERSGTVDDGEPGSSTRYWAAYWLGTYAHGRIDENWLQNEFLGAHVWYDRQGNRTDYVWSDERGMYVPVKFVNPHGASTICSHSGGYPETYKSEVPCPFMCVPADRTVHWIVYKPEFWVGPWESLTLSRGQVAE